MRLAQFLFVVLAIAVLASGSSGDRETTPLWAHVPDTISPEWGAFLLEKGKERERSLPEPDDIDGWTKVQAADRSVKEPLAEEVARSFGVTFVETTLGGVPVVEVTPKEGVREGAIAVYTHGGGYVMHSAKGLMASMAVFADATRLEVVGIDYTLAPHSKWKDATDEVVAVFKALLERGYTMDQIILYGDSAGGGLAAGSTLKMRDLGLGMPAALVLWSPWVDVTRAGDTHVTLRDAEPYYTYESILAPAALAYADEKDHKHPYVSPVYADFSKGFPPTLIQGGTKEILLSGFVRLYQALDQAGQTVKLDIYEGMPHVFQPTLPKTRESRAAMEKIRTWVDPHLIAR